jgi:hypothetical protein
MFHTELIMPMRFSQKAQISAVTLFALPLLNLPLHEREIAAEPEVLAIAEPYVVIGLAFSELYALSFETCIQLLERSVK